jgi:hypothetical protein
MEASDNIAGIDRSFSTHSQYAIGEEAFTELNSKLLGIFFT